jgi:hypothetical protein
MRRRLELGPDVGRSVATLKAAIERDENTSENVAWTVGICLRKLQGHYLLSSEMRSDFLLVVA